MKRIRVSILPILLAILTISAGCNAFANSFHEPITFEISGSLPYGKQQELRERMEQFFLENGGFSGAILVAQGDDIIISESFGITDFETENPNTLDTPFLLMDVTQIITGAAIFLLEMDGKLDTTDTLDNYFGGHENLRYVTVGHLLARRGGFGGNTPHVRAFLVEPDEIGNMTPSQFEPYAIAHWRGGALNCPYASMDYWMLGRVIEEASGMSYEEFVMTRIFEPAGMQNAGFIGIHESAMPLYMNFRFHDLWESLLNAEEFPFFLYFSMRGIVASANDLSLFLGAFFDGELFGEYMLDRIPVEEFNYGWWFHDSGLWYNTIIENVSPSEGSAIIYDPDSNTKIIVLSNLWTGNGTAGTLAELIAEVLFGIQI